jgi:hypothetical protein
MVEKKIGKPFEKGNKAASGRGPNKITRTVKETVLAAFQDLQEDPKANLLKWGKDNPTEFYKIAAKLIPTEVNAKVEDITVKQLIIESTGGKAEG